VRDSLNTFLTSLANYSSLHFNHHTFAKRAILCLVLTNVSPSCTGILLYYHEVPHTYSSNKQRLSIQCDLLSRFV
jgi:hypothetical protein